MTLYVISYIIIKSFFFMAVLTYGLRQSCFSISPIGFTSHTRDGPMKISSIPCYIRISRWNIPCPMSDRWNKIIVRQTAVKNFVPTVGNFCIPTTQTSLLVFHLGEYQGDYEWSNMKNPPCNLPARLFEGEEEKKQNHKTINYRPRTALRVPPWIELT